MNKDELKFLDDLISSYIDLRRIVEIDNANVVSEAYYVRTEKEIEDEHIRALGILNKVQSLMNENKSLTKQASDDSWITNPDRMGGQFTQDEIDNAGAWK